MCGILLVKSKSNIPLEQHLAAFSKLQSRGPDFFRYMNRGQVFLGHAVLHITGEADYYHQVQQNFLAYNGEIYNHKQFGPWTTDTALVHHAVENDMDLFKQFWGPWAWAWSDGTTVRYATDPQGERALYQYQDDDILIVSSEIAPILCYVQAQTREVPYQNKTWTMLSETPWQGIVKIPPGILYQDGEATHEIDSIWRWVGAPLHDNLQDAVEDFGQRWQEVLRLMTPAEPAALTYSGGLDSSLILSHVPDLELYAVNCLGKDPIVDRIQDFLTDEEQTRLHVLPLTEQAWAQDMLDMQQRLMMPASSWSWVGQWTATRHCEPRIMFTGTGADELFGGYDLYRTMKYHRDGSTSPYSQHGDPALWERCLEAYRGDLVQATMLMDYWYQVVGCDARAVDLITGAWGREARNPFMARPIMQLALRLPVHLRISFHSKPVIREMFLRRWPEELILPKKGFTGHANDALPWLGIQVEDTGDRLADWRNIVQRSFYAGHPAP